MTTTLKHLIHLASVVLLSFAMACGGTADQHADELERQGDLKPSEDADPAAACASLGGSCVGVAPGTCQGGHSVGEASCGGGIGVFCCVPDAAPSCAPLPAPAAGANPASSYCVALGYAWTADGQCALPDGTQCNEWAFYRGECGQAASFCRLHGGTVDNVTEQRDSDVLSYARCTLPGGKQCDEQDFARTCACP